MAAVEPLDSEPVLALANNLAPQQGETPMLRNWKVLALAAIIAAAPPNILLAQEKRNDVDSSKAMERLEKMMQDVRSKMDNVDKSLGDAFNKLAKDMSDLRNDIAPLKDLALRIDNLERSLSKLKTDMEMLAKNGTQTRTSMSPSSTGRIQIVNNYPEKLLFEINGRPYPVLPDRTEIIEGVPAGNFSYRVFSPQYGWIADTTSRMLDANRTFTISARLP
jgi:hypothetical protein